MYEDGSNRLSNGVKVRVDLTDPDKPSIRLDRPGFPSFVFDALGGGTKEQVASLGAKVKVFCYLGARQWNDRYFLELKYAGHELMQAPIIQAPQPVQTMPPGYIPQPDGLDKELPF